MSCCEDAVRLIEEQQKAVKDYSAAWMVGEQLKDICRREPQSAELIAQDLTVKEMSITEAEKQIEAFAKKHKVGNCGCVTPVQAERILRKFYKVNWSEGTREGGLGYHLPEAGEQPEPVKPAKKVLDLSDFM